MKYIFFSAVALVLFYLFYKWLLSRDTFHRFNRMVLLAVLLLTAVLPLIHFDFGQSGRALSYTLQELIITPANGYDSAQLESDELNDRPLFDIATLWWSDNAAMTVGVAFGFYLLVVFIFLYAFVYRLTGLVGRCRSKDVEVLPDGNRLLLHDDDYAPYSWMNTIVVSRKDYAANGPMILAHEKAHIRLGHSWDLLLAQLCCIVQWFNPAAWLIKKELQAVHEYEADEAMLNSGCNANEYQIKLIETALGARFSTMANNFTNVSTKKRILMMMKTKSAPLARLKALYILPVAAFVVFASSCPYQVKAHPSIDDDETSANVAVVSYVNDDVTPDSLAALEAEARKYLAENCKTASGADVKSETDEAGEELLEVCEELPLYPGGMEAMWKYMMQSIKYPAAARTLEQQGRVIIRFVVEKDGSVTNLEVLKSVSPLLDAEAVRMVKSMPKWTPGKQKGQPVRTHFVLPVTYKLK